MTGVLRVWSDGRCLHVGVPVRESGRHDGCEHYTGLLWRCPAHAGSTHSRGMYQVGGLHSRGMYEVGGLHSRRMYEVGGLHSRRMYEVGAMCTDAFLRNVCFILDLLTTCHRLSGLL